MASSNSSKVWNKVQVEILVHAPPASSGSLLRLLKSLQKANYFGPAPGLTIELPYDVDPSLTDFLGDFTWPPRTENRQFTLRRRISHNISAEEAAVRNIDAFYPRDPWYSHVLVLSPQTEVAPSFYHFLKYSLLKYKYSTPDALAAYHLLGISLDLPSSKPTDGSKFSPPKSELASLADDEKNVPVFLWQVPNSNAALYFGDKWIEFHSFLSNRFGPSLKMKQPNRPKSILSRYASWMEYMLEFIQARGYYLLYQSFATEDDFSLTTVHNELFHIPEEHASMPKVEASKQANDEANMSEQTLSGDLTDHDAKLDSVENILLEAPSISSLLDAFPGHLPHLSSLNILSPSGVVNDLDTLLNITEEFADTFRAEIGGCGAQNEPPDLVALSANDLFCLESNDA